MIEKHIENMGKVKFGKFYNKNNRKITNENTSPILNCKLVKIVSEKEISSKIANDYVYSILSKGEKIWKYIW